MSFCTSCGEEPQFEGGDDCLACFVAYALLEDPNQIESARKLFPGTTYLARIEAEVSRQTCTPIACGSIA